MHFVRLSAAAVFCINAANAANAYGQRDLGQHVRKADSLSEDEASWMSYRDQYTRDTLEQWVAQSDLDFDASSYFEGQTFPKYGIAFSGGGYRAMLSGAGALAALDGRVGDPSDPGNMGGLLQSASYMAGLSGGSWLVCSIVSNDYIPVPMLQYSGNLWNFTEPFKPAALGVSDGVDSHGTRLWILRLFSDVIQKARVGSPATFIDFWSKLITGNCLSAVDLNGNERFSEVMQKPSLRDYEYPFPIVLADGLDNIKYTSPPLNTTEYEFTPYEFGSWDPTVYSFIPLKKLDKVEDDIQSFEKFGNNKHTPQKYDNIGFIMGTSSTLFNRGVFDFLNSVDPNQRLLKLLKYIRSTTKSILDVHFDMPISMRNPFQNLTWVQGDMHSDKDLHLVDGGLNGENIPLNPLYKPERKLDAVFAFDNSADVDNWPNGAAIRLTYLRQQNTKQGNGSHFPYVPPTDELMYSRFKSRPVFFGCSAPEVGVVSPLLIYMPNAYYSARTNYPTFKLAYNDTERDSIIQNGNDLVTQRSGKIDPEWRSCVACALVLREQQRRGELPSPKCQRCFDYYCYSNNGYRHMED